MAAHRLLQRRVLQADAARVPIEQLLLEVAEQTPWVAKYGMTADFGIGDLQDPYVRVCRVRWRVKGVRRWFGGTLRGV